MIGLRLFRSAAKLQLVVPAVALVALLAGCNKPAQTTVAPPAPEVATFTVAQQPVLLTTDLPGTTAPYLIAEVRPQVNGLVQKRLFTEGSDVKAGQELYQIDPAPFQAALDNAKAALGKAEANLPAIKARADRYQRALAEKAVSQQDLEDAAAAQKQAEADIKYWTAMVETAQISLNYSRIVSPISGRIGRSTVTDGAIVTAYQPIALATIQQLDPIYVDVQQSTSELLRLRRCVEEGRLNSDSATANKVQLILADGTNYPQEGTLQFRDVSVDPSTASITVRMVFPNPNGVLLPGMFVRALVKEGINQQGILIPQQTVSRDPKGNAVALVVAGGGKVEQRVLTLDRAIGDQWLVSSGLAAGERIIAEGAQKVRPGAMVKEVPFNPAPAPAAAPVQQAAKAN